MNLYDCVIITAHPDDAFLNMGATIAKLVSSGKKVYVMSVSKGENGDKALGELRQNEFYASINTVKAEGLLLDFCDGAMVFQKEQMVNAIYNVLTKTNPEIIITHHFDDMHTDHITVYECCKLALERLWHTLKNKVNLKQFLSFSPSSLGLSRLPSLKFNVLHDISAFYKTKEMSIMIHQSQMPYIEKNRYQHNCLNKLLGSFVGCEYAEGFFVDSPTKLNSNVIFGFKEC